MSQVSKKINVFLADDHPLFRAGIRGLLENERTMNVIGEGANGQEVLTKMTGLPVEVLLLDIDMPEMSGLKLIEKVSLEFPQVNVLVFSMYDDDQYVHHMMTKGAKGYILKSCSKDELIRAIKTVHTGDSYLAKDVSNKIIHSLLQKDQTDKKTTDLPLTKREIEVIKQVATGRTNQEIGKLLHISPRTVDTHRRNIMEKLNLHNAAALTNYAAKNGLI